MLAHMLSSDFEITTPFTKIICQYKERGSNYPATPKPPRKKNLKPRT